MNISRRAGGSVLICRLGIEGAIVLDSSGAVYCIVTLSKTIFPLRSTGSTLEDRKMSRHDWTLLTRTYSINTNNYISKGQYFCSFLSIYNHFCYSFLVCVMLSRLFIVALWSPAENGLTSWLSFVMLNCGILAQVRCLIVSSPDLCHISYFHSVKL